MNKLYRSDTNKMISGVFGGLSEYLNIDANILRLIGFLIFINQPFSFIGVYIIATIIIPIDPGFIESSSNENFETKNTSLFIGIILIIIGLSFLLRLIFPTLNFNIFYQFRHILRRISNLWPVLLIGLGIYLITNNNDNNN